MVIDFSVFVLLDFGGRIRFSDIAHSSVHFYIRINYLVALELTELTKHFPVHIQEQEMIDLDFRRKYDVFGVFGVIYNLIISNKYCSLIQY